MSDNNETLYKLAAQVAVMRQNGSGGLPATEFLQRVKSFIAWFTLRWQPIMAKSV